MFRTLLFPLLFICTANLAATPAPDFTITDSGGKTRHLYQDFVNQGKVVVLEVFFTTCPPCATHAPHWQSLYESVKGKYGGQVEFFMLSDKSADINSVVAQYKISKGLTMPAAGSDGGSLEAVQPYKSGQFGPFYGTPTFIVIEPGTGEVLFDVRGGGPASTMDSIRQKIDQYLLPTCHIETPWGDTLLNYSLQVQVPGGGASVTLPVTNGMYSLEQVAGLPAASFYEVIPSKSGDPLNGVSTFDLVQINRQILGIMPFLEPWQFVAGDANNSNSITTFDIVEIRKLILGIYDSLPKAPSWAFMPGLDTMSALACPTFEAVKKGDVNGNAVATVVAGPDDRYAAPWVCKLVDGPSGPGEEQRIELQSFTGGEILGMQLAFHVDQEALEILDIHAPALPGFGSDCWHQNGHRLVVSWVGTSPASLLAADPMLVLTVRSGYSGSAGAMLYPEELPVRAEVYTSAIPVRPVEWLEARVPGVKVFPNPAKTYVSLALDRPLRTAQPVRLVDEMGRVVFEKQLEPLHVVPTQYVLYPGRVPPGIYRIWLADRPLGNLIWTGE
ncbi:MAG: redoxin domain-containing protein [Bacteroidetes bacterium]|nr:MAG: redoxin domain-containing protein [Bacteroidota bacterium]